MVFGGIQKLTLLDYPDKTACTLFTQGCNYRCPFCHNASLVMPAGGNQGIDEEAVLDFLKTRQRLLDGVCISGGEPLMYRELGTFIARVKALGFSIKLDTNGSFPDALEELVASKLVDYVAMDIKNAPEKYPQTIGLAAYDLTPVTRSVAFLLSGKVPYELRTTVVREFHTQADLVSLARWIKGAEKYYLQGFVDSGDMLAEGLSGYSAAEMACLLASIRDVLPNAQLRGI